MTATRRAPKSGYRNPNKEAYRANLYAGFKREFGSSVGTRRLLLMPSIEGDEICVALKAGFRIENLHVVDQNPAIVAVLNRRYGGKLNTYGCLVSDACWRIAHSGTKLDGANFDFCWQAGASHLREIMLAFSAPCWRSNVVYAVTVQRGRETGLERELCVDGDWPDEGRQRMPGYLERLRGRYYGEYEPTVADLGRLICTSLEPEPYSPIRRWGIYLGGRVTMLWALRTSSVQGIRATVRSYLGKNADGTERDAEFVRRAWRT